MRNKKRLLILLSTLIFSGCDFTPVNPEELAYLRLHERQAVELLDRWIEDLNRYKKIFAGEIGRENIGWAKDVVVCARGKLADGLDYVFSNTKMGAKTFPILGSLVQLNREFFRYNTDFQFATVIHEATHKCGTNDAAYFQNGEKPRSVWYSDWAFIASTYSYWASNGLCIPDYDC